MNILFVHRYFPTQFRHLATALAANPKNRVVAISHPAGGDKVHVEMPPNDKIQAVSYGAYLPQETYSVPRHAKPLVEDICAAWAVYDCARALSREDGFVPDLICGSSLWGESLYLRELFPQAKFLTSLELFYRLDRGYGFDAGKPIEQETRFPSLSKNASIAWAAATMDWGIASLQWQRDLFPAVYHPKISVIHEGIDTTLIAPGPARVTIEDKGITLKDGDEVVTYAARYFENVRGSDIFLRAVPKILEMRPDTHILLVGSEAKGEQGASVRVGATDVAAIISEFGDRIDPKRVHFLGRLDHAAFLNVLRLSTVHVYLSAPFILSWSFLEAMACGCAVVASANPPVTEVIAGADCGLEVDFFDPAAVAAATVELLADKKGTQARAAAARQIIVDRYDLHTVCLPQQLELIDRLMANELQ